MALPVDVSSIDVLRAVREAFILFAEDAQSSLGSMDAEIRRCIDWLTHDQRVYWQSEIKKRTEKLSEAKAELHRKQLSQMFGQHAHDSEQREHVRDAKRRLEEAEDKLEQVRRWLPVVERAVMEYNGQARPFADLVEFDVERSVGLLDNMIGALEEYIQIAPPTTTKPSGTSTSAAPRIETPTAVPPKDEPVVAPEPIPTTTEEAT